MPAKLTFAALATLSLTLATVALATLPSAALAAGGLSTKERLEDFAQLRALIQSQYGPFEFKQRAGIVKWDDLNREFEEKVRNAKTNQDFYSAIHEYVARFQDGHFAVLNPNDREATVPVSLDLIGAKVLITYIDRDKLPKDKFDFEVGDEVTEVNGQPVQAVLDELSRYIPAGNPLALRRKAAWAITVRRSGVLAVPKEEKLTLSIRRGTSSLVQPAELAWARKGSALDEDLTSDAVFQLASGHRGIPRHWDARSLDHSLFLNPRVDRRYACNPESRIKLPEGAEWVMKKPIAAYTYPTPKGRVGYVRIPDYYPTNDDDELTESSVRKWFEKLRFVMKKMEGSTVGLVIDQDHNCGGSVGLVEQVVSLFISKPEKPMLFSFRASKAAYIKYKAELASTTPDTISHEREEAFVKLVEATLRAGRGAMTPITPVTERAEILPEQEARYTKPVVILIDEMAGSGGDSFPAIMKGIGRAALFGRQTGGLGGSVEKFAPLHNSQLRIHMTVSLFFKPDGSPVENNGAVPDREYSLTRDDVVYGYEPYRRAYTEYLLERIP